MAKQQCAYCDTGDGNETDDHVPPKGLFPKPRPDNLITVPSCTECNTGDSKDDEYFKLTMAVRGEANDKTPAKTVIESVIRGLEREQAAGYAKVVAASMEKQDVTTPGGIYLGPRVVMTAELERLLVVVERTVRGLFFNEKSNCIPDSHDVSVFPLDTKTIDDNPPLRTLIAWISKTGFTTIGESTFSFSRVYADGDDTMSFWVLEFYETACFGALITPTPEE